MSLRSKLVRRRNKFQAGHAEPHLIDIHHHPTMSPFREFTLGNMERQERCRSTEHGRPWRYSASGEGWDLAVPTATPELHRADYVKEGSARISLHGVNLHSGTALQTPTSLIKELEKNGSNKKFSLHTTH